MQGAARAKEPKKAYLANSYNEESQTGKGIIFMPQMGRSTVLMHQSNYNNSK